MKNYGRFGTESALIQDPTKPSHFIEMSVEDAREILAQGEFPAI